MGWLKRHWQLLALTAALFALWQTPAVLPLKLLVVVLHELAHGLAALLTGGRIVSLTVSPEIGGLAITQGGNRFAILTAGYLGSLVIGAMLFVAALRTDADRAVLGGFGAVLALFALLYMRESFALLFTLGTGAALLAAAWLLPRDICDLALRILGLSSMIYVPYDIFSDTIARAHLVSDARLMAQDIGGPAQMWGTLWLVLSVIVIALCLRYALGRSSNIAIGPAAS